jgi:hypothetical protein
MYDGFYTITFSPAVFIKQGKGWDSMILRYFFKCDYLLTILHKEASEGGVAQMVERSLSMREVRGSIPCTSITFW